MRDAHQEELAAAGIIIIIVIITKVANSAIFAPPFVCVVELFGFRERFDALRTPALTSHGCCEVAG